jgi:hypothetical protein
MDWGFNVMIKMLMIGAHESRTFKNIEIGTMWMANGFENERTIEDNFVHSKQNEKLSSLSF